MSDRYILHFRLPKHEQSRLLASPIHRTYGLAISQPRYQRINIAIDQHKNWSAIRRNRSALQQMHALSYDCVAIAPKTIEPSRNESIKKGTEHRVGSYDPRRERSHETSKEERRESRGNSGRGVKFRQGRRQSERNKGILARFLFAVPRRIGSSYPISEKTTGRKRADGPQEKPKRIKEIWYEHGKGAEAAEERDGRGRKDERKRGRTRMRWNSA